jgi:hypothetical protein
MKKTRLISLVLVFALAFSALIPAAVTADDGEPEVVFTEEAAPEGEPEDGGKPAEEGQQPAGEDGQEEGGLAFNTDKLSVKLNPGKVISIGYGESQEITTTVKNAAGDVTYKWQFSSDKGTTWKSYGETGSSLVITVGDDNFDKVYGWQFRCVVRDGDGKKAVSSAVKMKAPYTVETPKSVDGGIGDKVKIKVSLEGHDKSETPKYQWQKKSEEGTAWKDATVSGSKTSRIKVKVSENTYFFQYRCVVTVGGVKMVSNPVKIEKPYKVTVSPGKKKVDIGDTVKFKVTMKGAEGKASYKWYVSRDGGNTWKTTTLSGSKTSTLKVKATNDRYGMMFRCLVSAKNGDVYSDAVWINPKNIGDFIFDDNGNHQWVISKYKKNAADVIVPAGYHGLPVVGIAANVFKGKALKTVVIPPSVKTIGESAFEDCASLKTVTISDNVTSIGTAAFKNCKNLANMKIANQ